MLKPRYNRYTKHCYKCTQHDPNENIEGFFAQLDYLYLHFPEKKEFLDLREAKFIIEMKSKLNERIKANPRNDELYRQKASLLSREEKPEKAIKNRYYAQLVKSLVPSLLETLSKTITSSRLAKKKHSLPMIDLFLASQVAPPFHSRCIITHDGQITAIG